jgi:hypothetical protein
MKALFLLLPAFVFFVAPLARARPLATADRACACRAEEHDPLEEPLRFAFGKFRGQCIDSCRFRRARVLESAAGELAVANVLHLGRYVQARIRLDQVAGVQVGFERFAPGVDHVLLRFTFTRDVPLFTQDGAAKPAGSTRAIVLSSEGVPPKGHPYSLAEGYWGYYLLDHRVLTGDELSRWVAKLRHPLRLLPLSLGGPAAGRVLESGIRRSDRESFASAYRLFANNCSTAALSLLDAETGFHAENWDPFHWEELEAALPIAGPLGTEHALRYRGLIGAATGAYSGGRAPGEAPARR